MVWLSRGKQVQAPCRVVIRVPVFESLIWLSRGKQIQAPCRGAFKVPVFESLIWLSRGKQIQAPCRGAIKVPVFMSVAWLNRNKQGKIPVSALLLGDIGGCLPAITTAIAVLQAWNTEAFRHSMALYERSVWMEKFSVGWGVLLMKDHSVRCTKHKEDMAALPWMPL